MTPLVSILIPAYNAERWIGQTLESALAQDWPNKEIIVLDDGSKDSTHAVAKRYEGRGIRVCTQRNAGAAAARNALLRLAKGDFIQWLDADDLLSVSKVSRQMAIFQAGAPTDTLVSCGWAYFLNRPQNAVFKKTALWRDLTAAEWLICKLSQNLHMQTATWLYSRRLAEKAGLWDERQIGDDDGEYFCRVLLASEGVKFTPEAKVYYRASGTSSVSYIGFSNKKLEAQLRSMRDHIKYLRSLEDSERVHHACLAYLRNWSIHFYPQRPDLFQQLQALAHEVGGTLPLPQLAWKYRWIEKMFGWNVAKRVQVAAPAFKWKVIRNFDRLLSRIDRPTVDGIVFR